MKFKLVEELQSKYPYMLRQDGKLIMVNEFQLDIHPYLVDRTLFRIETTDLNYMYRFIIGAIGLASLKWFYKYTTHNETKDEIRRFLLAFMNDESIVINDAEKQDIVDYFSIDYNPDFILNATDLKSSYAVLSDSLNQEFCRVRVGGRVVNKGDHSIWFRISSVRYNWFNNIWSVVYNNRHSLSTVNICYDLQSKDSEEFLKINNEVMSDFPVDDFITLSGNPVVEKMTNEEQKRLQEGMSVISSIHSNYYHVHNHIMQYLVEERKSLSEDVK